MGAKYTPRYFWRRVGAFVIDYVLASIFTTLLLLPFFNPDQGALRLSGFVNSNSCAPLKTVSPDIAALVAPEPINEAKLCENKANFIANGRTVHLIYAQRETKEGAVTYRTFKTVTAAVTPEGQVISAFRPQVFLSIVLMMLISAFLLARGKQSPGKRMLKLRVTGTGCGLCREVRRFAPLLVLEGLNVILAAGIGTAAAAVLLSNVWPLLAAGAAVITVLIYYFVWPMIRWRGAMRYDRATGFEVTRA